MRKYRLLLKHILKIDKEVKERGRKQWHGEENADNGKKGIKK